MDTLERAKDFHSGLKERCILPFLIAKTKILLLYCKKTYKMHVYFYVLYLSLDSIFDRDIHSVRIAEPLI